jgi:ribonuclease P protein component
MIVPLRPFGSAVKRNYARRRLREFYRLNRDRFPRGHDVLLRLFTAPGDWDRFLEHIAQLADSVSTTGNTGERR